MLKKQKFLQKLGKSYIGYQPYPHLKEAEKLAINQITNPREKKFAKIQQILPIKVSVSFFILYLNQGYDYTQFTDLTMKRFRQYLDHYHNNSYLNTILITNLDKEYFSKGTDFQYLQSQLRNGKTNKVKKYFDLLYKNIYFNSSYPKPVVIQLRGRLENSAIPYFCMFPFVYASQDTQINFNSVQNNCLPHGGESFILQGMPQHLGHYLALTGQSLNVKDLYDLNLIKGIKDISDEDIDVLKNFTHSEQFFPTFHESYTNIHEHVLSKRQDQENQVAEFLERSQKENPQEVILDLFYKKQILDQADINNSSENPNEFQVENSGEINQRMVENNHLNYEYFLDEHLQSENPKQFQNSIFFENLQIIGRCFNAKTIEEVKQLLLQEGSEFALITYNQLNEQNSSLLQMTMDLLNECNNKTLVECMQKEVNYMMTLVEKDELKSELFSNKKNTNQFTYNVKDHLFVLENQIQDFVPLKNFYRDFPEAFLCFFNNQPLKNIHQIKNYEDVVKKSLFRLGIDYYHPSFDKQLIKEKINLFFKQEIQMHKKYENYTRFLSNPKEQQNYLQQVKEQILLFEQNSQFENIVEKLIDEYFLQEYDQNVELMKKQNEKLNYLEYAKNTVEDLKKTFIQSLFSYDYSKKTSVKTDLLEINNHKDQLSTRYKDIVRYKDLAAKYRVNLIVSENEQNKYLSNEAINIQKIVQIKNENDIHVDWNRFHFDRKEEFSKNDKIEFNFDFYYYLHEHGIPDAEKNYRKRIINELQTFYESNIRTMNEEEKQQFREHIHHKFFKDYPTLEKKETFGLTWQKELLDFKRYDSIDEKVDVKIPSQKQNESFPEVNSEQLNDIYKVFNSNPEPFHYIFDSPSFLSYMINSPVVSQKQKKFFQLLHSLKSKKLIHNLVEKMEQKFFDKQKQLLSDREFNHQLEYLSNIQKQNLDHELREVLIPHVLYEPLNQTLEVFKYVFDIINKQPNIESHLKSLSLYDSNISYEENIQRIDQFILGCFEVIGEISNNLIFQEDIELYKFNVFKKNFIATIPRAQDHVEFIKSLNSQLMVDSEIKRDIIFQKFNKMDQTKFLQEYAQNANLFLEKFFTNLTLNTDFAYYMVDIEDELNQKLEENLQGNRQLNNKQKQDYIRQINDFINTNRRNLSIYKGLPDLSPFSIMQNYYYDFKQQYMNRALDDQEGDFFRQDKLNKLEIGVNEVVIVEKIISQLKNNGLGGIDYALKNLQDNTQQQEQLMPQPYDWVIMKLKQRINEVYSTRKTQEQYLSENDLINLDKILYQQFQKQNLINQLNKYYEIEEQKVKKMVDEYITNKENSLNLFKNWFLQDNFEVKDLDQDNIQIDHNLKSLFAFSEALKHHNKLSQTEYQEAYQIFQEYKERFIDMIKDKEILKIDKIKEQEPQLKLKPSMSFDDFAMENYILLKKKLQEKKLLNLNTQLISDIERVNKKIKVYESNQL